MYGMSPFGLAKNLGIGRDEAKNYINKFLLDSRAFMNTWTAREL